MWPGKLGASGHEEGAVAFIPAPDCPTLGVRLFLPELNGSKPVLKPLMLPPAAVFF